MDTHIVFRADAKLTVVLLCCLRAWLVHWLLLGAAADTKATLLPAGTNLVNPDCISSPNGMYRLCMRDDANLVLTGASGTVW